MAVNDAKWACLISNPDKVHDLENSKLIFYHGVVASSFYHDDQMLPSGYRQAIAVLFRKLNEELEFRLSEAAKKEAV